MGFLKKILFTLFSGFVQETIKWNSMVFSCSSYSRWDKIIIIIIIFIIIFIDGMILGCMFHGAGGGNSALGLGSDKDSISALGAGFFFIFTQVLKIMTIDALHYSF